MSKFLKSCLLASGILFAVSCVSASDVEMTEDHTKVSENVEDAKKVEATKTTVPTSKAKKKKHKGKAKKNKSKKTASTVAPVDAKSSDVAPVAKEATGEISEHKN